MNAEDTPVTSLTWTIEKRRFEWSPTLPSGRTITGHASTEDRARDMQDGWRVRGDKPRFVGPRTPHGGIGPYLEGGAAR